MTKRTRQTPTRPKAVWAFNRRLSNRLWGWAALSMVLGVMLQRGRDPFWRSVGQQALGWGAIDGAIAEVGQRDADRKAAAGDPAVAAAHARRLRLLLWLNAGLDVGYMAGGVFLARRQGQDNPSRRGHGWGIVLQGLFLFLFDLIHAFRVPIPPKPNEQHDRTRK